MFTKKFIPLLLCSSILSLGGCTTFNNLTEHTEHFVEGGHTVKTTKKQYSQTTPTSILLLKKQTLQTPYTIIGKITVNRYNMVGTKQQQAVINDIMRTHASKIGGNAVINIKVTKKQMTGDVVRFVS